MQKPRIPPHPTTKQEILFLRRMGFPAQKKMNIAKKFEQPKAGIKVSSCEEIIFRFSENN